MNKVQLMSIRRNFCAHVYLGGTSVTSIIQCNEVNESYFNTEKRSLKNSTNELKQ